MPTDKIKNIANGVSTIASVNVMVMFAVYAMYTTLWPVMADECGLTGNEIGIYLSLPVIVQLVGIPIVNHYAGHYGIEVF